MAKRMTEKFLQLGGQLTTRKRVTKIIVEKDTARGVILSDGTEINADYVISAADGHSTIFDMLEGKFVNEKILKAYDKWELFTPIVQVSFGISTVITSDNPVESWMIKDQMIGRTKTTQGYSIMNYCFDSTMAPKGKTVIVMRFDSPWDLWKDISEEEYKAEKENIEKDARILLEKHFPGISANIEVVDVATPITDVNYTGVWKGSYEGFMPSSKNLMDNLNPDCPDSKSFIWQDSGFSPEEVFLRQASLGNGLFSISVKMRRSDSRINNNSKSERKKYQNLNPILAK